MKKPLLLLLLIVSYQSLSQNGFMYNWHFGKHCSLNFSSGIPVAQNGSAMLTTETAISYSDSAGNLLFYTNGGEDIQINDGYVWNKNHQIMAGGNITNLLGSSTSAQGALAFHKAGTEYYLFTLDAQPSSNRGLKYSIIDMALDNGLGMLTTIGEDVITGYPNTVVTESFIGVRHANGVDHWIVSIAPTLNTFYVTLVTPNGIGATSAQSVPSQGGTIYQQKFNLQGTKMVSGTKLFDFDNSTGSFTGVSDITVDDQAFGLAFSKSGRYLYRSGLTSNGDIFLRQFDVTSPNIQASMIDLSSQLPTTEWILSLQIGPDYKIYFPYSNATVTNAYLGVINQPDLGGIACNVVEDQVQLSTDCIIDFGLPLFMDSDLNLNEFIGLIENKKSSYAVWPNPAEDEITIGNYKPYEPIAIYTSTGHLLEILEQEKNILNIEKFHSGLYFLKVDNNILKFVKQ